MTSADNHSRENANITEQEMQVTAALNALPGLPVPDHVRVAVQDHLDRHHQQGPDRSGVWLMALAACALPVIVGLVLVLRPDPSPGQMALADLEWRIAELERRSQRFESELAQLPPVGPAAPTMLVLEDRLAAVDARLNRRAPHPTAADVELWRTRADLIESYTRLRRDQTETLLRRAMY